MIQSDRFFNKLTLTNDNIPDDKLLGSCFYLTSKVIDETAVKAKNILNSNTLSFVYNASVEYKRELYISRGFVMQTAIEQYYNYLCSDEYLTLLINKRNEVLKEDSVCNQ